MKAPQKGTVTAAMNLGGGSYDLADLTKAASNAASEEELAKSLAGLNATPVPESSVRMEGYERAEVNGENIHVPVEAAEPESAKEPAPAADKK